LKKNTKATKVQPNLNFDWADLAFGSKKPLRELRAIFIAAPRELSQARLSQLVKQYLPEGNIVLGLAKEPYVDGFEGQAQFKTLQPADAQKLITKVNAAKLPHKIVTLGYFQRDFAYILDKLDFKKVLLINGSWKHMFHTLPAYYLLATRHTPYELLSPFASETEARVYAERTPLTEVPQSGRFSDIEMLELAGKVATQSYDYGFQTGVALGRKQGNKYELLATGFNRVVPFQTYAMHYGASREQHFSPVNDLNHYDTIHAEVDFILNAQKQGLDLHSTTLFINLLPCPACARMFTQTDITEFVYREDHSAGYAIKMLEAAGKKVRRIVA
jgi:deoxycytidylate deaminase